MIRVLIADDHPLVRQGIAKAIALELGFAAPGEAGSSASLLQMFEREQWDIIVLDLSMPGRGGLDALSEIRRRNKRVPVLILSMHSEMQYVTRAVKSGANGYLTKTAHPSEVVRAIRALIAGKSHFPFLVAESPAVTLASHGSRAPHETLNNRELLVMCRIAAGNTVAEVAREISLSAKTVHVYRARALKKMHMRTNLELTRYALLHGLIV